METTEHKATDRNGIIGALAELPADAVVSEEGLAKILGKHRVSIKRAVKRRELPVPVRMFGELVWTAGALRAHLNQRLEAARRDAERLQQRISQLAP